MEVTCHYCKHRWDYHGFSIYATCSHCRSVNKVRSRDMILKLTDKMGKDITHKGWKTKGDSDVSN